ncbi:MAG TPA: hypothetical protein VL359_04365 [bacterium]|nr:hypothetical protein [bacterium]
MEAASKGLTGQDGLAAARTVLASITPGTPQPALTRRIAECPCAEEVRAGLYLLNGDWDAAHRCAQELHSQVGAHWHALVHRHEPDFPNSKYWLARAGASPVYPVLAQAAEQEGQSQRVLRNGQWDPMRFTDCYADPKAEPWTRRLDSLEMRTLLDQLLR